MESLQKPIEKLYFNDNYDTDFILKNMFDMSSKIYKRNLVRQTQMTKIEKFGGLLSEFKVNPDLNLKAKLDSNSYSYLIPFNNIKYFNYKKLLNTYIDWYKVGNSSINRHVAFNQAEGLEKTELIKNRMLFFIDGKIYPAMDYVIMSSGLYIIIQTNVSGGLTDMEFINKQLTNKRWGLVLSIPSNFAMYNNLQTSSIVNNAIDNSVAADNKVAVYNNIYRSNYWLTSFADPTTTLMHSYYGSYSFANKAITLNSSFKESFITSSRGRLYAYEIPGCKKVVGISLSRFYTPENHDLYSPNGVLVFKKIGNELIYIDDAEVILHYPNILEVTNIPAAAPIVLFLCQYADGMLAKYEEPAELYIDYLNRDGSSLTFIDAIRNNSLPTILKTYMPYDFKYSAKDMITNLYDDGASYTLDNVVKIGLSDANRLREIYENRFRENYHHNIVFKAKMSDIWDTNMIRTSSTPDSSDISNYYDWDGEQVYLFKINHSTTDFLFDIVIWINGIRYYRYERFIENLIEYIYIPLADLSQNDEIVIEEFITDESYIKTYDMTFTSSTQKQQFPTNFTEISAQHMMFYDSDTKDIVPNSLFKMVMHGDNTILGLGTTETDESNLGLGVIPESTLLTLDKDIKRDYTNNSFYKYVPTKNLEISMNKEEYYGKAITITNNDIYKVDTFTDVRGINYISLSNWNLSRDGKNFRVTVGGKILSPGIDYEIFEAGSIEDFIHIRTKEELYTFISNINDGVISSDSSAILMNDIKVDSDFIQLETFGGLFEGYGYTISGIPMNSAQLSFMQKNEGTIKNLNLSFDITVTETEMPDIALNNTAIAYIDEGNTINCLVYGQIIASAGFDVDSIKLITEYDYKLSKFDSTYNDKTVYMICATEPAISTYAEKTVIHPTGKYGSALTIHFYKPVTGVNEIPAIIEYMPYKNILVGYIENNGDAVFIYPDIDRPFSYVYHTFVIDGNPALSDEIKIVSNHSIIVNKGTWNHVAIFTHGRDVDIYGRVYNPMTLVDRMMLDDPGFRSWVYDKYNE